MTGKFDRESAGISRRTMVRSVATGLATAIPVLGGCSAPIAWTDEQTDAPTTDEDDAWGFSVAVGPDGRPVFELGTEIPIRVQPGTTISFEWESDGHDIHVASQPEDSDWEGHESSEDAGFIHEHTFVVTGRYRFFCSTHRDDGMVGEIRVGDCDCGPPTATQGSG